jgi:hypothetical protein
MKKVKVKDLKKGMILISTGARILEQYESVGLSNNHRYVLIQYPNSQETYRRTWNANTLIAIQDPVTDAYFESVHGIGLPVIHIETGGSLTILSADLLDVIQDLGLRKSWDGEQYQVYNEALGRWQDASDYFDIRTLAAWYQTHRRKYKVVSYYTTVG